MRETQQMPLARQTVVRILSVVEDLVYVGLGVLLAISAFSLLGAGFKTFIAAAFSHALGAQFIGLLDQVLLILVFVELLYTVQVSFREHRVVAEPFMVVALIAIIRRILVITAETAHLPEASDAVFHRFVVELAMLTVLVLVLVASLIAFHRQARQTPADTNASSPDPH